MSQIYWRTKNKGLIKITDMSNEHLQNAIEMFENKDIHNEEIAAIKLELEYREQLQEQYEPEE